MLSPEDLAFSFYLNALDTASSEFRWRREQVIREWQRMPLKDRGLVCWLLGSNHERDLARPELGIAAEVHHRSIVAMLAANDPEGLAWAGYEEEEGVEEILCDRFGQLTSLVYRPRDKYAEAEELRTRLSNAREWSRRIGGNLPAILGRAKSLRE